MTRIKRTLPLTTQRVALHTKPSINARIRNKTIESLSIYNNSSDEIVSDRIEQLNDEVISARINCLNSEWDTERILEANAASIVIATTILGLTSNKYWFLLTGTVGAFLLQHALQGWCPPVPLIRKMGVRTAEEINNEKTVLKMIRRDFVQNNGGIEEMLLQAEKQ